MLAKATLKVIRDSYIPLSGFTLEYVESYQRHSDAEDDL
jgi:hypothetical protein